MKLQKQYLVHVDSNTQALLMAFRKSYPNATDAEVLGAAMILMRTLTYNKPDTTMSYTLHIVYKPKLENMSFWKRIRYMLKPKMRLTITV